ncbi:MAG: aminotransferase class V-fold PLP-dependent enzyme, partial [Thermoanaerobaculia bacterium]
EWLLERGVEAVRRELESLARELEAGLRAVPGLTLHGPEDLAAREPMFPVNLAGYRPDELAAALDAGFGVQTRAGLHCAPGAHRVLGTFPEGACRLSLGATSTREDVQAALEALRALAER